MSMEDLKRIFWGSLRMYFAPLTGAYKEVKAEMDRRARRHAE